MVWGRRGDEGGRGSVRGEGEEGFVASAARRRRRAWRWRRQRGGGRVVVASAAEVKVTTVAMVVPGTAVTADEWVVETVSKKVNIKLLYVIKVNC